MRDYVVLLIIAGLIPVSLFRPFIGLLAWSWISYMNPHKLGWGIAAHQPVAMAIGLAALLGFFFSRESKKIPMQGMVYWYGAFMFWILVTFLASTKIDEVYAQADKILKIQLFVLVSFMMVQTRERLNALLAVIAGSIGFFGVKGGIFTITSGGGERVWGPPGSFIEGNNELGLAMLMVTPLFVYFAQILQKPWQRYAMWACAFLCVVAVLGTHSRGALLALIALLVIVWLRSKHKLGILIAALVLVPTLWVAAPENWRNRMATMKTEERAQLVVPSEVTRSGYCAQITAHMQERDASFGGRVNAWCMALNLASHEVFGGGLAAFSRSNFYLYAPAPEDYHDAHSIYFQVLGEHGFIGLILFLIMLGWTTLEAGRLRKRTRGQAGLEWAFALAGMLQGCLVAFAVGGTFLGLSYFDLVYHLIVAVVALKLIVSRPYEVATSVGMGNAPVRRFANMLSGRIS